MVIGQIAGMKGIVYILRSGSSARYYIGSTNNLARRLDEHRLGKTKYLKSFGSFKIVFQQEYKTLEDARKIEHKLKRLKSRIIIESIG